MTGCADCRPEYTFCCFLSLSYFFLISYFRLFLSLSVFLSFLVLSVPLSFFLSFSFSLSLFLSPSPSVSLSCVSVPVPCVPGVPSVLASSHTFLLYFYLFTRMYSCVTRMHSYVTRMLPVCTHMYLYVIGVYPYVLVWCFSHDLHWALQTPTLLKETDCSFARLFKTRGVLLWPWIVSFCIQN